MVSNNYNSNTGGGHTVSTSSDDDSSTGFVGNAKEVGANVKLETNNGDEIPVTNASFSEEAETSEVQYTTGFHKSIAVTGVTYSGSFEVAGEAQSLRAEGWANGQSSAGETSLPQNMGTITFKDGSDNQYTFHNVLLNSHSRDAPSDDRTTMSFDFMAERLIKSTADESEDDN